LNVELVAVEFVAVAQQHAEQRDNMQNKETTCRTKRQHAEQRDNMQNKETTCRTKEHRRFFLCGALIINKVYP
jgi:hypothetical protein